MEYIGSGGLVMSRSFTQTLKLTESEENLHCLGGFFKIIYKSCKLNRRGGEMKLIEMAREEKPTFTAIKADCLAADRKAWR